MGPEAVRNGPNPLDIARFKTGLTGLMPSQTPLAIFICEAPLPWLNSCSLFGTGLCDEATNPMARNLTNLDAMKSTAGY
jgi:hypothetical protein